VQHVRQLDVLPAITPLPAVASVLDCWWSVKVALVTLFPLSDGGVLVALSTCAVLRGGGYYLVPALSVAYLLA
jgi:hypothetical protein